MEEAYGATYVTGFLTYWPPMIGYVDTTNLDTMLEGLAWRSFNAPMQRQAMTHSQLWVQDILRVCREFKIDSLLLLGNRACKHFWAMHKLVAEPAKEELGSPSCTFEFEIHDSRIMPPLHVQKKAGHVFRDAPGHARRTVKRMMKSDRAVIAITGRGGRENDPDVDYGQAADRKCGQQDPGSRRRPADRPDICHGQPAEKTISEIRRKMIEEPEERKRDQKQEHRDVIDEAVTDVGGVSLLIMGRAEGQGCFCRASTSCSSMGSSLYPGIRRDLIDCEAGIEQVNRRVISSVDTLIIVRNASVRGIQTAGSCGQSSANTTNRNRTGPCGCQ
jgi:hypothetical protein